MADMKLLEYLGNFISEQRKERFMEILEQRTKHLTVAIEDVYQLHNTSAVIRSCEAFGIQNVHVIENRFGKRLDKKIAMGAQQWVDVRRYQGMLDCIETLRKEGYQIIATTPHSGNCSPSNFDITEKAALLFGTEREGLSEVALRECDGFLTIPMYGFTESLNISVSAAIILQRLTDRLKASEVAWQLTGEERLALRLDWTKKSIKSIDDILDRYRLDLQGET